MYMGLYGENENKGKTERERRAVAKAQWKLHGMKMGAEREGRKRETGREEK